MRLRSLDPVGNEIVLGRHRDDRLEQPGCIGADAQIALVDETGDFASAAGVALADLGERQRKRLMPRGFLERALGLLEPDIPTVDHLHRVRRGE